MALLVAGETCARLESADRLAFMVDCQSYFAALAAAISAARRQVFLLGWTFDPRTRLAPDGLVRHGAPDEIGRLLIAACEKNPALDVRVLIWRSALPISATQDFFPHRAKAWFEDTGVQFPLDADGALRRLPSSEGGGHRRRRRLLSAAPTSAATAGTPRPISISDARRLSPMAAASTRRGTR